ncbi:hypothetical protein ALQ43_04220 [Pseudomonas savastanoi pv. glycinea]|nr:hypothetical protein ALQ43_04220 [Pseudomonas savastanoi pv. glycinea]
MVELHQQLFFVAAFGHGRRAHQFGMAADQVDQNRQQAQALAVDDDAQFQVEPVSFVLFVDDRVPVFHRRDVETELVLNVDFPALLAQSRQVVEDEMQPGLVVGQFVHVAGAVGQRLALPGGDLEAQVGQFLTQLPLPFALTTDAQGFGVGVLDDVAFLIHQIAAQRTDQNADVGGADRVMLAVGKGERGTVLNVPLHAPVARLVGTELDAGQNQPGPWLQVIDQALRQPGFLLYGLFRLLLVQGQCGLQQRTVLRVLQKQQGSHAMFAIVANRAGAFAGQVILVAIGVLEQQCLGIDFQARAPTGGADDLRAGVFQHDAFLPGVVAPSLERSLVE